jgi:hypothetical protein
MWVATEDLPRSAAHPFYTRLNEIFDNADFDGYVESLCQRFYADDMGARGCRPAATSVCCCSDTSKGSTPSARLRGARPIR